MSADKLPAELLREIEATFYPGAGKRFRQDRGMLLEAILLPVDYIHSQRDLVAAPSLYREIVRKVIAIIRAHGTPGSGGGFVSTTKGLRPGGYSSPSK